MKVKLIPAMLVYLALALLAFFTLEGKIRVATLVFLAGFALKTWLVDLKNRMD